MYKLALLALVACRYQDPVAEQPDASAPPDESGPVDPPEMLGRFGAPQLVAELSTTDSDGTAEMTADGLEIFFQSIRPGGLGSNDIWTARRTSTTDPWSTPVLVTELSSATRDVFPHISLDGLRMYLVSSRSGTSGADIYITARATRSATWAPPTPVAELNTVANEDRVSVTADELLLVLDSERENAGRDLYFSTRSSTSMPWSAPVAIAELNTSEFDAQAIISADGLAIYFAHGPTVGDRDLFVATRASRSAPFGPPTLLDEASSTTEDNDPWISADQRTLLFSSLRSGNRDIYIATR